MNLTEALRGPDVVGKLRDLDVVGRLRVMAEEDLRREAIEGVMYARAQVLLEEARAEAAELEDTIKESDAAILSAEAEVENKQKLFEEAREHYGAPPRSETETAMNEAQQELRAARAELDSHQHRKYQAKPRLDKLRDLEAVLVAVAEPELDALRELAALV